MKIGTTTRLKAALWESEDSATLNTSFVERLNLTIRHPHRRRLPPANKKKDPGYTGICRDIVGWFLLTGGQRRVVGDGGGRVRVGTTGDGGGRGGAGCEGVTDLVEGPAGGERGQHGPQGVGDGRNGGFGVVEIGGI